MVAYTCNPAFWMLIQKDCKFKVSLGCSARRPALSQNKSKTRLCRDGLSVKRVGCSSRGSQRSSQHPHNGSAICNSSSRKSNTIVSMASKGTRHVCGAQAYVQAKHSYTYQRHTQNLAKSSGWSSDVKPSPPPVQNVRRVMPRKDQEAVTKAYTFFRKECC